MTAIEAQLIERLKKLPPARVAVIQVLESVLAQAGAQASTR